MTILQLAEIAPGNFRGHYFVDRGLRLAIVQCEIAKAISRVVFARCAKGARHSRTVPKRSTSEAPAKPHLGAKSTQESANSRKLEQGTAHAAQ